jgi:exoribonuclease II
MQVFYEEEGQFKVASVMAENTGSMQVESPTGKRSKIKSNNVLLQISWKLIFCGSVVASQSLVLRI